MAKITIEIEDHGEDGLTAVKWTKDPDGHLDGEGTPAEQIAYYVLLMLYGAKVPEPAKPGESN